ncbi:MAG: DNA primase [Dehalococcoidia bacterium]|nr:DNA primase [Dehalococcoidia bacterium]
MSVIDEIKERVDIVEVVSEYVPGLKKTGRNYRGLCPFHSEKTPSFFVFPERQSWHCFGACGAGGDVFSFIMKKENVDFGEALRVLAGRAGITLIGRRDKVDDKLDELYRVNEMAAKYYHHLLLVSPSAEKARAYLLGRGVSADTIEKFQLGFSLDSWDSLRQLLASKGSLEQGLSAGLLVQKDDGGSYDRFRNHIVFPICNIHGKVAGFGARVLDDSLPKYLNSPQTKIFDKSSILYGSALARDSIRRQGVVVIVEGYMDVIIAHQHGFDNVVASMGTSLTDKQVKTLRKLTKSFTLALDADEAGRMATMRGLESVWHVTEGAGRLVGGRDSMEEIKIVSMPSGKDPDDVIKNDPEEWQRLLDSAQHWADFIFGMIASEVKSDDVQSKTAAADQMLSFIAAMPDPIGQAHYLQKLARLVKVDEKTLAVSMKRFRSISPSRHKGKSNGQLDVSRKSIRDPREDYYLSLLFHYPVLKNVDEDMSTEYFRHTENRELFMAWQRASDIKSMIESLDISLREQFNYLVTKKLPPMSEDEKVRAFTDCIRHLRERWLRDLKAKEALLLSDTDEECSDDGLNETEQRGLNRNVQLRKLFVQARERR